VAFDADTWHHTVFEALRPIDPDALFRVCLTELDFRAVGSNRPEDFPGDDLVGFVNQWLAGLDPDAEASTTEWSGGGVRLILHARGRGASWRGWRGMPSFNLLEPVMGDLHLRPGGRRRLIDLTLTEVEKLAAGDLRMVGQRASYLDAFHMLADEMRTFQCQEVVEMHPMVIIGYAGMLGLVSAPPALGNFDATWNAVHRHRPDD
jgi:hypothetical protein